MSSVARPDQDGLYRIKHLARGLYLSLQGNGVKLEKFDPNNKSQIWKLTRQPDRRTWKIDSEQGDAALAKILGKPTDSLWSLAVEDGRARLMLGDDTLNSKLALAPPSRNTEGNFFVFDPVQEATHHHRRGFQDHFFSLTPEAAKEEKYDIIIIGTGIGGGVLAADLFETNEKVGGNAKKVLVIEKGSLIFHSHCLNASRPAGLDEDRGQQNDTFFGAFKSPYTVDPKSDSISSGGPMYCLGGRSAAWGLFSPRIHDKTLETHFPTTVMKDLIPKFYKKAERLMNLSLPVTKPHHQHLLDRLNIAGLDYGVSWQWGRIASEFADSRNFDFAEGAYSTIDRLLEIAMSKPVNAKYYEYFKILLDVEARTINWKPGSKTADSVTAMSLDGEFKFRLNQGGRVVVCAGSVASPAILLRSGVDLHEMGGCHLTDHDIMYKTRSFRYKDPSERKEVGAMKLQTYAKIGPKETDIALVNMSLDASTFLPRSKAPYNDLPKFIIVFILWAPLQSGSNIKLNTDKEPVVTIKRYEQKDAMEDMKKKMSLLTDASIDMIKQVLNVTFLDKEPDDFGTLGLGGVAHELGSIPMPDPSTKVKACLDEDLKLNGHEGVYVCDLSVFPYSPEANPTLTLAALAMRLSRKLVPRETAGRVEDDSIDIINHSGNTVEVVVSNRKGKQDNPRPNMMSTGASASWKRTKGCPECVFVFRIKPEWKPRKPDDTPEFSEIPEFLVGYPGQLLVIQ